MMRYVNNPDLYLMPSYRISPFTTSLIGRNCQIDNNYGRIAINYLNNRFGEDNWIITDSGRQAIFIVLKNLGLSKHNIISIHTPSKNQYISSCVTREIEKFCSWNREDLTEIILINHEFGYIHPELVGLRNKSKILIEDCCTTFFSQDSDGKIGLLGDYTVYSFPKFFGIQIGGLLVGRKIARNDKFIYNKFENSNKLNYILNVVGYELNFLSDSIKIRKSNFDYATELFKELGFTLYFQNSDGVVPLVILFNNNCVIKNLVNYKEYLYKHGIQNSIFYGKDAFFLPIHQNLTKFDLDYFRFVTENYIINDNK